MEWTHLCLSQSQYSSNTNGTQMCPNMIMPLHRTQIAAGIEREIERRTHTHTANKIGWVEQIDKLHNRFYWSDTLN